MTSADIMPTHTCFEDVTLYFPLLIREKLSRKNDPGFLMVHAVCLLPNDKEYSHAWIEEGGLVHFSGIFQGVRGWALVEREEFYKVFRVQETTKYNFWELFRAAVHNGNTPPPWEKRYRDLCGDDKTLYRGPEVTVARRTE